MLIPLLSIVSVVADLTSLADIDPWILLALGGASVIALVITLTLERHGIGRRGITIAFAVLAVAASGACLALGVSEGKRQSQRPGALHPRQSASALSEPSPSRSADMPATPDQPINRPPADARTSNTLDSDSRHPSALPTADGYRKSGTVDAVDPCVVGRWGPVEGEIDYQGDGTGPPTRLGLLGGSSLVLQNDKDGTSRTNGGLTFVGAAQGHTVRLVQTSRVTLRISTRGEQMRRQEFAGQISDSLYVDNQKYGPMAEEMSSYEKGYSCTDDGLELEFPSGWLKLERIN
ncbi:hypothetical protein [Paractinoplanes durhamensis]|uniref:hypothetical protein n=1 Tax=Paractinoplanes durhamensis TaxID=113563 RepID=UPI0031D811A9